MRNGVFFIFKTLIKVPCYIFATYLVFNIFAFGYSYLQVLNIFYTVNGIVMENNYIPTQQLNTINQQMNRLETRMLRNIQLTPATPDRLSERKQYGETITVGVEAEFHWMWPIMPHEQFGGVYGTSEDTPFQGNAYYQGKDWDEINEMKNNNGNGFKILIEHEAPALKYYADDEL